MSFLQSHLDSQDKDESLFRWVRVFAEFEALEEGGDLPAFVRKHWRWIRDCVLNKMGSICHPKEEAEIQRRVRPIIDMVVQEVRMDNWIQKQSEIDDPSMVYPLGRLFLI